MRQVLKREVDIFQIIPVLMVALFPIVGISLILFASSLTSFRCQRNDANKGSCELMTVSSPFQWKKTQTFMLNQIEEAAVATTSSSRSSSSYHSLLITTDTGDIRISMPGYTQGGVEIQVNQLNQFLKQPQQKSVTIEQPDDRLGIYFIGTVFTVVPVYGCLWRYYHARRKTKQDK
jgi:hypothetical protein